MQERHTTTDLDKMFQGISIPSCPAILTELIGTLRASDVNNRVITELIERDVGLAALVIKAANSPLFGVNRTIDSISDAIALLGLTTLNNLVHQGLLRSALGKGDTSLDRFWDNSAHSAAVCAKLAERLNCAVPASTAYTFGLFHDCGIPLLVQHFPNYKTILATANQSLDQRFTDIEDAAINTNHAAVGCLLARTWGLSEPISTAILCHHDYSILINAQGLSDESRTLVALSAIADHIVGLYLRVKQDIEWLKSRDAVSIYFGLNLTDLDEIVDNMLDLLETQKQ